MSEKYQIKFKNVVKEDPILKAVLYYCYNGWPKSKTAIPWDNILKNEDKLLVENGLVYFDNRVIVPSKLIPQILEKQKLEQKHVSIGFI